MFAFNSIKELIKTLAWSTELLSEMFEKRKSFAYKYEQAIEILEESKVESLIDKEVLRRNGNFIEIDDQFLQFFEQILEVNEEISSSYINENIQQIKQNINYYFQENSESRKYGYLKSVKSALRKVGRIIIRNIVDLNRNIENTFKIEPNYKIKISKLYNYDKKRGDISKLIGQTELLLANDEITFFKIAIDEELNQIMIQLRSQLHEGRHNLIEVQKQIIDFLNQIKYQSKVLEKIRQLKYLKDEHEIRSKTDIKVLLSENNAVFFETNPVYPLKLSLASLQDDEIYESILKINRKVKFDIKPQLVLAEKISEEYFQTETEEEMSIDIEKIRNGFLASGHHLFNFVINYQYPRELSFEEKVLLYCQLVSIYETEFAFSDEYNRYREIEYAIVYPK
ncbi:MAG: hypothetical protein NUV58_01485 [Candidatus Roizmanbacteria bacterium]|nr:hypothetical protein [Candidatus Roizmanbacteria bacterium]